MKYLVLGLLLAGCGKGETAMPDSVKPYYAEYVSIVGENHVTNGNIIIIDEHQLLPNQLGVCTTFWNSPWLIQINQQAWLNLSEVLQKQLIYHELTHCFFDSPSHSLDSTSYMYAYSIYPVVDLDMQVYKYTNDLETFDNSNNLVDEAIFSRL